MYNPPPIFFLQRKKEEKGKTGMPRAQPLLRLSGKERATVASVLPCIALLAVVVGIVGQGAEALTIEETDEWQACVRNPSGCTRLSLEDRGLTGSIPAAIGDFVNLERVWLDDNQLSGSIPPEIGNCVKLEVLELQNNQLSGSIPPQIGNCVELRQLDLHNNNLQGVIPDIWKAMEDTLTTLDLHGNNLTGSVPTDLFEMGFYSFNPLTSLNLGDNLLSGPVPTHYLNKKYKLSHKLTSYFTELWLLGNNWDGGPCVAFCGGINVGALDDAKRASAKIWANKCLEDTDSHKGLADSAYSIDDLGRCSFKSSTCSKATYYVERRTIADPDCKRCPVHTFQPNSSHTDTECDIQPTCGAGQSISKDDDDLRTERRSCAACATNTYQSSDEHRLTECIDQPTCGAGQKMANDTKTKRRQCSDCPAGQYQDDSEHRSTTCTEQPKCGPGTLFRGSLYAERTCDACPPNRYQPAIDHTEPTCIPQQGCLPQHEFVGDSTTKGRCEPCKDGSVQLQPKNNHFDVCIDISLLESPTTVCNDAGELDSDGTCECNKGFAGPQCEFSSEETCNGFGRVSYNAQANSASCSNCTDPAVGVGDRCQFSNSETCKDFGTVSGDGTCDWNRNLQGEPLVSECDAGYYYNPNPETAGNEADEDEDAIDVGTDNCYPCSPGHFATGTARRVQCDACPTVSVETDDGALRAMLQTSEPASTSASDCFAKFQSAAADQQFCYGENVDAKPLSRITSSDDCSISATSLGLMFAGEFVLPYPGCMYDEGHQEARFYVGQSQYDQALSTASPSSDNNNDNDDSNDNDGSSRRRRNERQQHQQRRWKQQQPREQDQQPQRRSHQKRRRKLKLVPMKDTPLCELYVCKDPKNEVTALTSNPADAGATPSCKVSVAQIKEAYAAEQAESQSTFMPAAFSLSATALVGSYVHQYRSASKAGLAFTIWHHLGAWLTSLRVFDMLTDFGFYFVSLHGSEAFLEAYSDDPVLNECGQPETNPYEEPKVAAFLYISVFCTALGLFMTPLDIWAMSQRSVGGGMGIVGVAVVLSITLFEDTPQLALASIYINTMREVDIDPDPISILSLAASALSMLFNVITVVYYTRKLRVQDPTGWWRIGGAEGGAENARLRAEVSALNKRVAKLTQRSNGASDTLVQMDNPMFNVDATNTDDYVEVQGALEAQTSGRKQPEVQFGGFADANNEVDACESGKQTGKECARPKAGKSKYCKKHTCKEKKCYRMKSSKAKYCNQHTGNEL